MQTFIFKKVELTETDLMEQIYRLRFDVYSRECGFINEQNYPNGLEIDDYDKHSLHFVALDQDGEAVGTVRLILPSKLTFPLEKHCDNLNVQGNSLPRNSIAEISRLVISKKLRRRWDDDLYYGPQVHDQKIIDKNNNEFLRRAKPMAFGLYKEVYQESKRCGITHWYALMEKGLWLLLRIHGFVFEKIGEEIDFFGSVTPYLGDVASIEQNVWKRYPKFFDYFTDKLEHEYISDFQE